MDTLLLPSSVSTLHAICSLLTLFLRTQSIVFDVVSLLKECVGCEHVFDVKEMFQRKSTAGVADGFRMPLLEGGLFPLCC